MFSNLIKKKVVLMNRRNYDDLKYSDEIMLSIRSDIYLIGIIESYFNSLFFNKIIDKIFYLN